MYCFKQYIRTTKMTNEIKENGSIIPEIALLTPKGRYVFFYIDINMKYFTSELSR